MVTKHIYIIAYDISNNKRRCEVSQLLEEHGIRMNKSVFECLMLPKTYKALMKTVNGKINPKKDTVLYYPICRNCFEKSERTGKADGNSLMITV